MKKKLIAYYGDSPVHVEGFPTDCDRSCVGSVHVLPRKPVTVTEAEYEYMKTHYKWMMPKLRVVAELGGKEGASAPSSPPEAKEEKPSSTGGKKSKKKKAKKKAKKKKR